VDGSDATTANVALGYACVPRPRLGAEVRSGAAAPAPAPRPGQTVLVPRVFYNPDLRSRWFYVPAVLAMILMIMTMLLSAMGVVREKEIGTLEQIIVTPIRPWQLLVGKLLPFALIGLFQMCLATAVTVFGFGVPLRGSFALLLSLTALFILSTLGLGLLVSTVVQNQQQAMMGAAFGAMVPMIYLRASSSPSTTCRRPSSS
jgi:ABC-2 type transport system permease protein